jgi:hypothetical protein
MAGAPDKRETDRRVRWRKRDIEIAREREDMPCATASYLDLTNNTIHTSARTHRISNISVFDVKRTDYRPHRQLLSFSHSSVGGTEIEELVD